jgi:hypothetical protein
MSWSNIYNNKGIICYGVLERGSCHMLLHMNLAFVLHFLETFLITGWSCWHEILTAFLKNCPSVLAKEGDFLSCSLILMTPWIMMSESIFVMQQQGKQNVSCQAKYIFSYAQGHRCAFLYVRYWQFHEGICNILTLLGVLWGPELFRGGEELW